MDLSLYLAHKHRLNIGTINKGDAEYLGGGTLLIHILILKHAFLRIAYIHIYMYEYM